MKVTSANCTHYDIEMNILEGDHRAGGWALRTKRVPEKDLGKQLDGMDGCIGIQFISATPVYCVESIAEEPLNEMFITSTLNSYRHDKERIAVQKQLEQKKKEVEELTSKLNRMGG